MKGRGLLPAWAADYHRPHLRSDLAAGVTVGAMLVPQAMAYALLAGLPPEVGLYAATVPVVVYALLGTSRQLAVGPVAIVSLLTASALAPVVEEGTVGYVAAAALLALLVGVLHVVLGVARLGLVVHLLSHPVLVGFTAAAAVIIGVSQVKHVLGIDIERRSLVHETLFDVVASIGETNGATLAVGLASLLALVGCKRYRPRWPAALLVVVGSVLAVEVLDLDARGVAVVGDIPTALPVFAVPTVDGSIVVDLARAAVVITLVGFMESMAVAKVYARRHRYNVVPNRELVGLGGANVAAGLFGGYPVTGGFSRTAVNDAAGGRTPLASIVAATVVVATLAFFTPLLQSLPKAALGAVIITAVVGLFDVGEMRRIAAVKRTDLVALVAAFVATLALGIELGVVVAVAVSLLVVFARMSMPHMAVLGRLPGTVVFRNVDRFPEATTVDGVRIVRVDAPLSFVNADLVRRRLLRHGAAIADVEPGVLLLDASGVTDLDATAVEVLHELLQELEALGVALWLCGVKGPLRDVFRSAGLWEALDGRIYADAYEASVAIAADHPSAATDGHVRQPITTT
ncbi:MAG: sulfate permease [Actinomycetota bacterium]